MVLAERSPAAIGKNWHSFIAGIVLLFAWEAFGCLYDRPMLIPWPSHIVFVSFPSLAIFGGAEVPDTWFAMRILASQLTVTLGRIAVGVVGGGILGLAFGVAAFSVAVHCRREPPLLVLIRSLPPFALIPLFVLWFAGSEVGVWLYLTFSVSMLVATGTYQAIDNVPSRYLLQARLMGASRLQRLTTVVFPAIVPEVAGTVRNVLGMSWALSLGAEYAGASDGLGRLVYLSYTYADMGKIAALAAVYAASGLVAFFIWSLAWTGAVGQRWRLSKGVVQ